jgi:hypothetical protein
MDDIVFLTSYNSQVQKLKAVLNKSFRICLSRRSLETLLFEGSGNDSQG